VAFEVHYRLPDGTELVSHNDLRFRSYGWLHHALVETGFQVDPVDHDVPELVFMATSAQLRRPLVVRIYTSTDGEWLAAILYDSSETVTVPISRLDTCTVRKPSFGYAARSYSLIRPCTTFLRRTRTVPRSMTGVGSVSLSGGRWPRP
jgi:hypothetical protein